jgi:hypothetical protein
VSIPYLIRTAPHIMLIAVVHLRKCCPLVRNAMILRDVICKVLMALQYSVTVSPEALMQP